MKVKQFGFLLALSLSVATAPAAFRVDSAFAPRFFQSTNVNSLSFVTDIQLQSDGRIVAGGGFQTVSGAPSQNLARLNSDGSMDAAFGARQSFKGDFDGLVTSVLLDTAGRILVTGFFTNVQGAPRPGIARLLPSGALDATFVPDFRNFGKPEGVRLEADGRMLVLGLGLANNIYNRNNVPIIRLTENGQYDPSFAVSDNIRINVGSKWVAQNLRAEIQPDGKLLVAGGISTINPLATYGLIRFLQNGAVDPSFTLPPSTNFTSLTDLKLLPDGRFLTTERRVRLWNTNGLEVPNFPAELTGQIDAMIVTRGQQILASDFFGFKWFGLDGTLQGELPMVQSYLNKYSLREALDGSIYVAGTKGGPEDFQGIWRLRAIGSGYTDWTAGQTNAVRLGRWESFLNDGIPNFARYAFGIPLNAAWTSPLRADADGRVRLRFNTTAEEGTIRLRHRYSLTTGNWVDVAVRSSGTWSVSDPNFTVHENAAGEIEITSVSPQHAYFIATVEDSATAN